MKFIAIAALIMSATALKLDQLTSGPSDEQLERIVKRQTKRWDTDKDNKISLEEYITASMAKIDKECSSTGAVPEKCTDEAKAKIKEHFEAIFKDADEDGSGYVDQEELKAAVA